MSDYLVAKDKEDVSVYSRLSFSWITRIVVQARHGLIRAKDLVFFTNMTAERCEALVQEQWTKQLALEK